MIVDANLLLYAVDSTADRHEAARAWLENVLNGPQRVGLPWDSLGAFLRVVTHPRALSRPLSGRAAYSFVSDWLAAEASWVPVPGPGHSEILRGLVERHDVRGNLVPDARLAALAIEHGLEIRSVDTDFARFDGVRWSDPLR